MTRRLGTCRTTPAAGGFTLLELTVVFGLLAGFLVMLTQMLSSGVELFDEGETGQELADLGNVVATSAAKSLGDLVGPEREGYHKGPPDARLLVQWVPLGLSADEQQTAGTVQAVRGTVRLDEVEESALLSVALRSRAEQMEGSMEPEDIQARLDDLLARAPRTGRGEMLLLPWPSGDPDGAFLELRQAVVLPDHRIVLGGESRRRTVGLMEVDRLDRGPLRSEHIESLTRPIATGLLHFELSFWSQYTKSFDQKGDGGPEWVWDSARAGLLSDDVDDRRQTFTLDLFEDSLENSTDDVYPRAARIVVVVANVGPPALLAEDLGTGESQMRLLSTDRLPDLEATRFLKVGSEWVRHAGVSDTVLTGLKRGQRGTVAVPHPQGTPVRAGKTIVLLVDLPAGRDNWNG